jgi:hypothetical protein
MSSKFQSRPLADLAAVAANAGVQVGDLETSALWVVGTFVGTAQVQISPDNVNWVDEGAALTTPGRVSIPGDAQFVRVNVTAYTSGTVESVVTGVDEDRLG